MTVNAIPKRVLSSELTEGYKCPVDSVSESSEPTAEWVRCPLVSDEHISLGSCLDLQDLARSEGFYSDPYLDMFEAIAACKEVPIENARRICLRHQADLLTDMISKADEDGDGVRRTLFRVYSRLAEEFEDS